MLQRYQLAVIVAALAVLVGCAVPGSAKRLGERSVVLAGNLGNEELLFNSKSLSGYLGPSEGPPISGPEESAVVRAELAEETAQRAILTKIGETAWGAATKHIPWLGGLAGIGLGLVELLRRRKVVGRLHAGYRAIELVRKMWDNGQHSSALAQALQAGHELLGVAKDVKADLTELGLSKK